MTKDEKEGCNLAFKSGAHARRSNSPPNCPYGSEIKAIYYEAWHKGWIEQDKRIESCTSLG